MLAKRIIKMKNRPYIVAVCLMCMWTSSARGNAIWESKDYGSQPQLSYLAFKYGAMLLDKLEGNERINLARELTIMSFYYWLDSKRNEELFNRGVEIMIKTKLHPAFSDLEKQLDEPFYKDPLVWLNHEKPVINPTSRYRMDKEQYRRYLAEFTRFLNSPISKPRVRVRK